MRGIILAAGRGSRMKHLTSERPKCMVKLRGKPLIEWQLEALRAAGINDIAIVTGYRHELLSSYKLTKFHNARWTETNMVASLACADKWLRSEPSIVSYSDIFYESSAVTSLIDCPGSLAVTYDPNWLSIWEKRFEDPLSDAETFSLNSSNQIIEIGNKPKTAKEVQGHLQKVGGKLIFSGQVSRLMLGEVEELWDWIAIAEYPSRKAMRSMIMDKDYRKSEEHRSAGLAGQLNIETKPHQ